MSYPKSVLALLVISGFTSHLLAESPASSAELELVDGKLSMIVPEVWESVAPKSQMISSEFRAPKEAKDDAARITVMNASGSVDANIDRWIGQFDGAKKEDAKIDKMDVAGTTLHIVDLAGTFKDSTGGGPFAPGPVKKRENYRMIAAVIETKDAGKIFVKMTGPQATVEGLAEGFRKSLENMTAK